MEGAALLGPHMHYVGLSIDRQRTRARDEARAFAVADSKGKKAQLDAYKEKLMAEARERLRAAQLKNAGRSKRQLARLSYLEGQRYNFINGNTRVNARIKYTAIADPLRSSACALSPVEGAEK